MVDLTIFWTYFVVFPSSFVNIHSNIRYKPCNHRFCTCNDSWTVWWNIHRTLHANRPCIVSRWFVLKMDLFFCYDRWRTDLLSFLLARSACSCRNIRQKSLDVWRKIWLALAIFNGNSPPKFRDLDFFFGKFFTNRNSAFATNRYLVLWPSRLSWILRFRIYIFRYISI